MRGRGRRSTAWHALPPPLHARTLCTCSTHKSMSAHPSERARGRAATSPIFIRRSYVVNSWDGPTERGECGGGGKASCLRQNIQAVGRKEGRSRSCLSPERTTRTYWPWSPFPHRDPRPRPSLASFPSHACICRGNRRICFRHHS